MILKAYGEITLSIVNDGENGTSPYFVSVGNESQNIPCKNDGITSTNLLINIPFAGYHGTNRTECSATIGSLPNGITLGGNEPSSESKDGNILLNVVQNSDLGGAQVLSGEIDISFQLQETIINKKFTWTKTKDGDTANLYQLSPSSLVIKKGADNTLSPATIVFTSTVTKGNSDTKEPYKGRFIIEESKDGASYTSKYLSSQDESEKEYSPSSTNIKVIKCTLCASGSVTNVLDTQSIIVLTDIDNIDGALEEIRTEVSSVSLKVDAAEKSIKEEVWRDTLIKVVDENGNIVERSLENLLVSHNVDLNGVTTQVKDVKTKYENEVPSLQEQVSTVSQNQAQFEVTVKDTYETKENASSNYTSIKEDAKRITLEAVSEEYAKKSESVDAVEVLYYLSSSSTELKDGTWKYPAPDWVDGKYMWSKQVTTKTDGTTSETKPTCIAGATGATGKTGATGEAGRDGTSGSTIKSFTPEYCLSEYKTTLPSDITWSSTRPEWEEGKYIWTRSKIVYINYTYNEKTENTDESEVVKYTDPVCDTVSEVIEKAKASLDVKYDEISQKVESANGNVSSLKTTVDGIQSEVKDARGNKSSLSVRLNGIENNVSDATGNASSALQTAKENTTKILDVEGNVSTLQQTSSKLESQIKSAEGDISSLKQDKDSIKLTVSNLNFNGRNYILNSKFNNLENNDYMTFDDGVLTFEDNLGITDDELTTLTLDCVPNIQYSSNDDDKIFLTFDYYTDSLVAGEHNYALFTMRVTFSDGEINSKSTSMGISEADNKKWKKKILKIDKVDEEYTKKITVTFSKKDSSGVFRIRNPKLEIGTKPTGYSIAQEDINNGINDAQTTADEANKNSKNAMSEIDLLKDQVVMMVKDDDGRTSFKQTADGFVFDITSTKEQIDAALDQAASAEGKADEANATTEELKKQVNTISEKTAYMNLDADENGDPIMELGNRETDFKVRITNKAMEFYDGDNKDEPVAYITNQTLYIQRSIVKETLQFGETAGFTWVLRDNGNLGLRAF